MTDAWVPFGLDEEQAEQYRVLVPGVPEWLQESLIEWLNARFQRQNSAWYDAVPLRNIQTTLRLDLGVRAGASLVEGAPVRQILRQITDMELLRVVDFVLSWQRSGTPSVRDLEGALAQAQSAYCVGHRIGNLGLLQRVPEGVRQAVEAVATTSEGPGRLLARAWADVHAFQPNDTSGYALAVRGVESAAIAVVEPENADATLGSVIAKMRRDGDWRLPLREHEYAPSAEMLVQMLRTLYRGHRDRHGNLDYSDVTHEEARAAVVLAATLIDWFASGAIARRPDVGPVEAAPRGG